MRNPLLLLFILVSNILSAQSPDTIRKDEKFPFEFHLNSIKDKDSLRIIKKEIDTIKTGLAKNNKSEIPFNASNKWTLEYFQFFGWHENFPGHRYSIDENYISTKPDTILSAKEIFETFKINSNLTNHNFPISELPQVFERDALFNGQWTALLPDENYLLIRYVHSYPNGNQTSWYHERIYYFRKVEKK